MDFEKLGSFYLGKEYDLERDERLQELLMLDARDLTTHAVCVGMTGSGKTGLCIDLLEEAAIDNVPAIIIDVKGDMTNLLLGFPELQAEDFLPWINPDDARRKGLQPLEFASRQADAWRKGLGEWGQQATRIQTLNDSVDRVIYTPGSRAGVPVSILQSFEAPKLDWEEDTELIRERIQALVSGLLGLLGVDADPVRSRENILLANIFEHFWRRGEDLDLGRIITAIQSPPMKKLGVFDVDTFFPPNDRFKLAMALNNIVASPGFQGWLEGEPLDVAGFLASPQGKPRHSIFYIAHLSEVERMFFVTMLLNQIITWMRTQSGTTSLRALLYMDEIFGYFPPVANPPSKKPMLTLLKQARAFGVGVVLSTQNPVDLDYKGLTNAGIWLIGRLQTERDKRRLLEGLHSASSDGGLQTSQLSELISDLGNRVFLMHNVHEDRPVTFQTRWAMSYLRGPMTRRQVKELMRDRKTESTAGRGPAAGSASGVSSQVDGLSDSPTPLEGGRKHVFLPLVRSWSDIEQDLQQSAGQVDVARKELLYAPHLAGIGEVHFIDSARGISEQQEFALLTDPPQRLSSGDWDEARPVQLTTRDLRSDPEQSGKFLPVSSALVTKRKLTSLEKVLDDHLYRTRRLSIFYYRPLKLYGLPGEGERDFRMRLQQQIREKRDDQVDSLEQRYGKRLEKLRDRLRRTKVTLEKKEETASARKRETLISVGESVLGMFMGRSSRRTASAALSKYRMGSTARRAAEEVEETVRSLKREMEELESELKGAVAKIEGEWDASIANLEEKTIAPRRTDIEIDFFGLVWAPRWRIWYTDDRGIESSTVIGAT